MLTRRGWTLVAASLAFAAAGRVFGIVELYVLAATAVALAAAALAYVRLRPVQVETARVLHPPRTHAGTSSRVELEVVNLASRPSPVLTVQDPFDGGRRWARFLVAPLAPRSSSRAAYRLPTDDRGIYDIGPLQVVLGDPFGLAATAIEGSPVTQLTVYPRVDVVRPLPQTRGHDPHSGRDHPTPLIGLGEDFYALRAYELGDDTRRVHWPSTARLDELMIRQDEMPWQSRATILLDVRAGVHTAESFELAVSAATSILQACRRGRSLVRLVSTDGTDSSFAADHAHAEAILEHLATVQLSRTDRLPRVAARLRGPGNGGALAVVTTAGTPSSDVEAIARLQNVYGGLVLVLIERSAYDASPAALRVPHRPAPPMRTVVRVTADDPFPLAWDRALSGARAGARP